MRYEVKTKLNGTVAVRYSQSAAIKAAQKLRSPVVLIIERPRKNCIPIGSITLENGIPVRSASLVEPCQRMLDKMADELRSNL